MMETPPTPMTVPPGVALIKCHVQSCIAALRDEDGRAKTYELGIAVRHLREAVMWIDEHQRLA